MSGRGKRPKQSWRTKLSNACAKGTGCSFEPWQVEDAYRSLIGALPHEEVYGRTLSPPSTKE